jgi:hypothetical protein
MSGHGVPDVKAEWKRWSPDHIKDQSVVMGGVHPNPVKAIPPARTSGQMQAVGPVKTVDTLVSAGDFKTCDSLVPCSEISEISAGTGESPMQNSPKTKRGRIRTTGKADYRFAEPKHSTSKNTDDAFTMKAQLQAIRNENLSSVFIARHINKLGFSSADVLRSYFSRFGPVRDVLVAHSRVKDFRQTGNSRVRPAGLGFVIMESPADSAKIMKDGPDYLIYGVTVKVQEFRIQDSAVDDDHKPELQQCDFPQVEPEFFPSCDYAQQGARQRWHSPGSDTSNY